MSAVRSVQTNVMWNGARTDFFRPQRSVRQRDPMSPYLFVLCMDKLSHLITECVENGQCIGIKAGRNDPSISHLMFACDLYYLAKLVSPKGVLHETQKYQRGFIWGDEENHRHIHAIGWDMVARAKKIGGLGMRRLPIMNTTFLMKIGWNLRSNFEALWCQVLRGKYNRHPVTAQGSWLAKGADSSLWKSLVSLEEQFDKYEHWALCNGRGVKAWH